MCWVKFSPNLSVAFLQLGCAIVILGSYDGFECHPPVVTVMTLELSLIVEPFKARTR